MVTLLVDSDALEVTLSPTERALARRREPLLIPRAQIKKAMITPDLWPWLRGRPQPGNTLPGGTAYGTWRSEAGNDFVLARRRRPGVVIELDGNEFDRVLVSTRHATDLVKALGVEDGTFESE